MRLTDPRPLDALSLTFLADAAFPALYAHLTEPLVIPTTDLTLHYTPAAMEPDARPGECVLGVFTNVVTQNGFAVEDGLLWSRDAELLAVARQLRRVLVPRRESETDRVHAHGAST
jgi:acyl-Coa thioesterase superfamily protein